MPGETSALLQEMLAATQELGYYETPRRATHKDVAYEH